MCAAIHVTLPILHQFIQNRIKKIFFKTEIILFEVCEVQLHRFRIIFL